MQGRVARAVGRNAQRHGAIRPRNRLRARHLRRVGGDRHLRIAADTRIHAADANAGEELRLAGRHAQHMVAHRLQNRRVAALQKHV